MWNLDFKVRENLPDKNFAIDRNDWLLKGIKDWMKKKHEIIEEALVSVTHLCKTASRNFANHDSSNQKDHNHKDTIEKDAHKDHHEA